MLAAQAYELEHEPTVTRGSGGQFLTTDDALLGVIQRFCRPNSLKREKAQLCFGLGRAGQR